MSPRSARPRPTTGKVAQARAATARARLAAQQEQAARRRRRLLWVVLPVALVMIAVGVLVVVRVAGGRPSASPGVAAAPAADSVVSTVTSVPASVLDTVGAGSVRTPPQRIDAPALTEGGKPRVLYVGAEYCPYCAAERWPMVVALSRFGTFQNLGQTTSAADDVYPSTPTLSFHGSGFTSTSVAFTGVETEGNELVNGRYAPLDTLSATDQQLVTTYNAPPYVSSAGAIPFVDIGGRYLISGASYDPSVLKGKTHEQVAAALADPTSPIAQGVDGTANLVTAAICATTSGAPAQVCQAAGVQAAAKALP